MNQTIQIGNILIEKTEKNGKELYSVYEVEINWEKEEEILFRATFCYPSDLFEYIHMTLKGGNI